MRCARPPRHPTGGHSENAHSSSKFKLITPLDAPVASREDTVSVVNAADPAAIGRTWRVLDVGQTSTLAVVRTTFLDQNTQSSTSGGTS
ncbi:DUF6093 family protein [Streptomyces sp. NPDC020489]|uniref:DUF6093 family protein n=1 Tax=Streptomyces sp. NPDC020489 TaxID=3365077 RepID=UPI0037A8F034